MKATLTYLLITVLTLIVSCDLFAQAAVDADLARADFVRLEEQNPAEAASIYEKVAKNTKAPANVREKAWLGLGRCLNALGKQEDATKAFRTAAKGKSAAARDAKTILSGGPIDIDPRFVGRIRRALDLMRNGEGSQHDGGKDALVYLGKEAVPFIAHEMRLHNDDPHFVESIVEVIGRIGGEGARRFLQDGATSQDVFFRRTLISALNKSKKKLRGLGDESLRDEYAVFLTDKDDFVRGKAVSLVVSVRNLYPEPDVVEKFIASASTEEKKTLYRWTSWFRFLDRASVKKLIPLILEDAKSTPELRTDVLRLLSNYPQERMAMQILPSLEVLDMMTLDDMENQSLNTRIRDISILDDPAESARAWEIALNYAKKLGNANGLRQNHHGHMQSGPTENMQRQLGNDVEHCFQAIVNSLTSTRGRKELLLPDGNVVLEMARLGYITERYIRQWLALPETGMTADELLNFYLAFPRNWDVAHRVAEREPSDAGIAKIRSTLSDAFSILDEKKTTERIREEIRAAARILTSPASLLRREIVMEIVARDARALTWLTQSHGSERILTPEVSMTILNSTMASDAIPSGTKNRLFRTALRGPNSAHLKTFLRAYEIGIDGSVFTDGRTKRNNARGIALYEYHRKKGKYLTSFERVDEFHSATWLAVAKALVEAGDVNAIADLEKSIELGERQDVTFMDDAARLLESKASSLSPEQARVVIPTLLRSWDRLENPVALAMFGVKYAEGDKKTQLDIKAAAFRALVKNEKLSGSAEVRKSVLVFLRENQGKEYVRGILTSSGSSASMTTVITAWPKDKLEELSFCKENPYSKVIMPWVQAMIRRDGAKALPKIASLFEHRSHLMRIYMIDAAIRIPTPEVLPHLIRRLVDKQEEVRIKAKTTLEQLDLYFAQQERWASRIEGKGPAAAPVDALLKKAKDGKTKGVKLAAIASLGTLGDPRALPFLVELLESNDADIRTVATSALERLNAPKSSTPTKDKK